VSSIRKKPSGRYEARYRDPEGRLRGKTFKTRKAAQEFLDRTGTDIANHAWRDPALGRVRLSEYADWWLANRADLRPRTRELYAGLFRLHIEPSLGGCRFDDLTSATVRAWHGRMLQAGKPGPVTVAKAYRLLRTVLNDAVEDGLLVRNPCTIRGAGVERSPERPTASVAQVYELADAIEPRYRLMILLATFCGLRLGELLALRRGTVNLLHRRLEVVEQLQELSSGALEFGPPKSAAGVRSVSVPPHVVDDLEAHLAQWVEAEPRSLLFTGPRTDVLRRLTFTSAWNRARNAAGLPQLHFHDLRHTGNTLAASTGASTKELMVRMGHSSTRAALIYQHASLERDAAIADGVSELVTKELRKSAH
jgi:integrase